ncbi:MAG: hypothetical protein ABIT01_16900 [Thermoanaerobaculia bacterium]
MRGAFGLLAGGALVLVLLTVLLMAVLRLVAASRRRTFLPALGPIVRIATPCGVAVGQASVPGTVGLTPEALVWDAPFGLSGSVPLGHIKRLETDAALASGRGFLRARALRVTLENGRVHEFVLSKGHEWEWRQALGEWVGQQIRASLPR